MLVVGPSVASSFLRRSAAWVGPNCPGRRGGDGAAWADLWSSTARYAESGANRGRRARRLVMSPDCGLGLVPAVGVECRGGGGDGVEGGLGVDGQADQAGVAALGHEDG